MIAYQALVISVLVIAAIALLLSIAILVEKARRELRVFRDRQRREELEPRILALVHRGIGTDGTNGPGEPDGPGRLRVPDGVMVKSLEAGSAMGARTAGVALAEPPVETPAAKPAARPARTLKEPDRPFLAEFGLPLTRAERRVREAILCDHALRVQGRARERISQAFEEFGLVDHYLEGSTGRTWWRRADSAERLGFARCERAIDRLVMMMSDPVPEVRLRAAKALGEIRGRTAVRPLLDALAQPNRWSTLRIAEILARMGNDAAEGIRNVYPNLPGPARLASLDILAKLRRLESLDFLIGVLKKGNPDERARAAHALGTTGHPRPVDDLVRAIHDPEWPVRAMAAKALGRIGGSEGIMALASALTDKEWWVRSNAANALKGMGPRGEKALLSVLMLADTYARHQAVLMLEESGVVEGYVDALDATQPAAREEAETLVRKLVKLGRIDYLVDLAREYPNPRVRTRLGQLLRESIS